MTADADDDTRKSASAPARTRSWMPAGIALVLFVVAILAASVAGRPSIEVGRSDAAPLPLPGAESTLTGTPPPPPGGERPDNALLIIGMVLALIIVSLLVILLIWTIRMLIRAWRDRPLRRQQGIEVDVEVNGAEPVGAAEPDAPTVRRGIAAARTAVDAHADPSDAIVAAWLGLEETAVDSGIGRALSETQVEFTLRMLLRRPGIEEPARDLLSLYEGVRFGGRVAGEHDRTAAARALALIEAGWR
ncbi:hypothetical protein QF046_000151 [Microbacterium sp. W4I4]|uniref:DUF4129 domain-containing protein n=1 Tax=Microbacterium sp. W4I4 TaxID=3042295 RepID=UPI00278B7BD1|nr:DUF4129 domain-containing protein [Microbacterium sp. W4I4]MDQ0612510.1 hypothetical protein [Microbacterium sp. W4I4]